VQAFAPRLLHLAALLVGVTTSFKPLLKSEIGERDFFIRLKNKGAFSILRVDTGNHENEWRESSQLASPPLDAQSPTRHSRHDDGAGGPRREPPTARGLGET
jgi:hypothetical protein